VSGIPKLTGGRLAAAGAMVALLATACGAAATDRAPVGGGTVKYAEQAGAPPNYIFPMLADEVESNANLYQFDNQLYLPLYWFGDDGQATVNKKLSVAEQPVFSNNNTVVTITLKHWQWSNGDPITARDVIFWMNLVSAVNDPNAPAVSSSSGAPGPSWAGSVPGEFPQNIVSYAQTGTYTLTMKLNQSYNPTWYLYNELSEIYPMPQNVWDKYSASGAIGNADTTAAARTTLPGTSPLSYVPANPGTATTGALAVAQFLNVQSQNLATYTTDPLWKVVDGPFKLSQFTTSGYVKLIPNTAYSGSPKPSISAFEEEPFTTQTAEFDALRSGSLTIGYIPTEDLAQKKTLEKDEGYKFSQWHGFGFVYMPYNFTNPTSGPVFSQLYIRQAIQSLVNQPELIKQFQDGLGEPDNGPVPTYPPSNPYASSLESKGVVYTYDPAKAVKLLQEHGWTVDPGGQSSCSKPGTGAGECGAGIKENQQLSFGLLFSAGTVELTNEVDAMQSTMKAKAGISLSLKSVTTQQVASTIEDGCTPAKPCTDWDLADVAVGFTWTYGPDFDPTGDELFKSGSVDDSGGYDNAVNNANVEATLTAPSSAAEFAALHKYENYLAKQLPVVWMPNGDIQLTMYKSDLKGLVPQDVFDIIYPQDYSLGKS
jgi:peptide/nickel transport system substrate-binding protein